MKAERLKQIEEIYHAALEISPSKRESFFNEFCGGDEELRREIEDLLSFEKSSNNFLDTPPESLVAEMFSKQNNHTNLIGKAVNQYKILALIGKGGMGEVFLAQDTKLDRKVALKILPPEFAEDANRMSRFVREAKSASALNHPNIITIHEIGESEGTHFIATEFIDGITLNEYKQANPLNYKAALEIAIQVASALDEAHSAGIVHRDIKPDNVMIRANGLVKILDFGIAKFAEQKGKIGEEDATPGLSPHLPYSPSSCLSTSPGMIIGTANYMSPEQAKGKEVDARTDIFSFGVVLYEMIAGQLPFDGENALEMIGSILKDEPKPLNAEVPIEIAKIINKCLRKDRDERYQTIKDIGNDLRDVKQDLEFQDKLERTVSTDKIELKTQILQATTAGEAQEYVVPHLGGEVLETQKIPLKSETTKSIPNSKYLLIGLLTLLLAVGGFFGYKYLSPTKQIESIAVMPFANETGNANNEYLSDGLTDVLINKLSQLPHIKVIARSSSFKYKGKELETSEIAKALGVQAIVTGRITQQGDNLQISVEMINAAENTQIWGETYNRKVSDVLAVQQDIARTVSEKLLIQLSVTQEKQIAKQFTANSQAYQFYLNGVFFRRKNGVENIRKAIEYQKQAISLDANFTLAYIELSINLANLIEIGAVSPKEGLPPARAAAETSLALDDELADAYYNIARIRKYEFEWTKAETAFKQSIEMNPNLAAAHTIYAEYLSQVGRFDEALREIKIAQELDPLRTGLTGNEGSIYYFARRYDEAVVNKQIHVGSAAENPFAHLGLANAYVAKGQYAEAFLSYQTSIKLEETTSALIYLGRLYALTGRRAEATAILEKLNTTEKYVSPTELAILYAALGDKEKAFVSLEKAYAERDFKLNELKVEPGYDSLRDDPRFKELVKKVGFPE